MNTSGQLEERILKSMQAGARLVFHCGRVGSWNDGFTVIERIALERNGQELRLTNDRRHDDFLVDEDGANLRHYNDRFQETAIDLADRICKRSDIRQAYAGYRSDYDTRWREVYEHRDMPVPRWISEQWETPCARLGH